MLSYSHLRKMSTIEVIHIIRPDVPQMYFSPPNGIASKLIPIRSKYSV